MQHSCRIATETRKFTELSVLFCVSVAIAFLVFISACTSDQRTEDPFREFIIVINSKYDMNLS